MWDEIVEQISETTGKAFRLAKASPVGGGCINEAYRLDGDGGPFFAKLNRADELEMFEAEADGLCDIAATETIRVPHPVCRGISGGQSYLVLEHIELGGGGSQSELGRRLAKLHAVPQPKFGWRRDNTIGSTPQANPASGDWVAFLREHRLGFQCRLAQRNGLRLDGAQEMLGQLGGFFTDYEPRASLLHGDLWSGNVAFGPGGDLWSGNVASRSRLPNAQAAVSALPHAQPLQYFRRRLRLGGGRHRRPLAASAVNKKSPGHHDRGMVEIVFVTRLPRPVPARLRHPHRRQRLAQRRCVARWIRFGSAWHPDRFRTPLPRPASCRGTPAREA